jgi:hypothetical protein
MKKYKDLTFMVCLVEFPNPQRNKPNVLIQRRKLLMMDMRVGMVGYIFGKL